MDPAKEKASEWERKAEEGAAPAPRRQELEGSRWV